jgi:hypothetical protein
MTSPSHKPTNFLFAVVVTWVVLLSAGPILAVLLHAAVPLVIAAGVVVVVLRLVLFHTRKW